MVLRYILIIALLFCFGNCTNPQAEREKEINALFKAIQRHQAKDSIAIGAPMSDRFGRFMPENFWNVLEDNEDNEFILYYDEEHMKYIELQYKELKKRNINHWSNTNIDTGKIIVDIDITTLSSLEILKDEWWNAYIKLYEYKDIQLYSYPLLNPTHTEAYFVFSYYSVEQNNTIPSYIYIKNEKGEWEYSSKEPL